MIKKFLEWLELKIKLNDLINDPPLVNERDLWWISFGENVGSEIDGKSKLFSRPGLILKKLSHNFYLVAPTTTKIRKGTWYVTIKHERREICICLHQIRAIDYRRLSSRMGQIDGDDFAKIKQAFWSLYK